jgi:hypothetical protein
MFRPNMWNMGRSAMVDLFSGIITETQCLVCISVVIGPTYGM